jgi:ribosomal protein S18 acetylase RimI-like enzyme
MAIKKEFSRMGYGSILIDSLEKIGLDKKVGNFFLNSRINAISFYKKNGYEKINKVSPSFGEIVHYRMEKILDNR